MESPDMKPDLSMLKREVDADLGDQPVNKSRRTDVKNSSSSSLPNSSARIKIEPNENEQVENPEQDENISADSFTVVQYESSINFKGEKETTETESEGISYEDQNPAQNEDVSIKNKETESGPKERVKCKFPGCKVICLSAQALQNHYNSRHEGKNKNINNNNNINNNSDVIYSSTPPPSAGTTSNKNDNNSQSEETNNNNNVSSSSSTKNGNKGDKSTSKISCSICKEQFKNNKSLYKHKFHKHGILEVQSSKNDAVSSGDPSDSNPNPTQNSNSNPKASVTQDVMKDTYKLSTAGVSSSDSEFKCPVPSCENKTFEALYLLEKHCLKDHRGQKFPWCGQDKFLKCPIYGCRRKLFLQQSGLEMHLIVVHTMNKIDAVSSAAAVCSGSGGNRIEIVEEKEVFECYFENCSYTTLAQCEWDSHKRLHIGDTLRFKCNVENCGVAFFKQDTLEKHHRMLHGRTKFIRFPEQN